MILILLYWTYLFWLFNVYGISIFKIYKSNAHPCIILILGAFTITVLASIYSFFSNLSVVFEGGIFVLSLGLFYKNKCLFKGLVLSTKERIYKLTRFSKLVLLVVTLLCAFQSASAPYLIDNESYYLQTIQWLDSYGLIKGVANLLPFLMQFSGWHILQSATNLEFLGFPLNDLSSFTLVIGLFYSVEKLDSYLRFQISTSLYAGLFIVFTVFLFRFISVPSPDIAVFVMGLLVFYECYIWLENNERLEETLHLLFLVSVFAIFVKLTAILIILFPVTSYFINKENISGGLKIKLRSSTIPLSRKRKRLFITTAILSICSGLLFFLKNFIISGYALFPLTIRIGSPDWRVAEHIIEWYSEQTYLDAFQTTSSTFLIDKSFLELIVYWLSLPGADGYFNKAIAVVLLFFPILLWKKKWNPFIITLYVLSLLQLLLIWMNAPQFRFFFLFFMLLTSVIVSEIPFRKWVVQTGVTAAIIITAIPIFITLNLGDTSSTSQLAISKPFDWNHIWIPHPNTRYVDLKHEEIEFGNTTLSSPINLDFFWGTGDCKVPCVQIKQLEYFKKYFQSFPQQRTSDISDGFYAKNFTSE